MDPCYRLARPSAPGILPIASSMLQFTKTRPGAYTMKRWPFALLAALTLSTLSAAVQTPEQYFGFRIGADKKLVRWDRIVAWLPRR